MGSNFKFSNYFKFSKKMSKKFLRWWPITFCPKRNEISSFKNNPKSYSRHGFDRIFLDILQYPAGRAASEIFCLSWWMDAHRIHEIGYSQSFSSLAISRIKPDETFVCTISRPCIDVENDVPTCATTCTYGNENSLTLITFLFPSCSFPPLSSVILRSKFHRIYLFTYFVLSFFF